MRNLQNLVLVLFIVGVSALAQNVSLERWDFLPDPSGNLTVEKLASAHGWRQARAGLSWQAQFDDLRDYAGDAWYRTSIDVPKSERPRRVLLRFGAVDYTATVYVNGKRVTTHEGGYTPFTCDVTDLVHSGNNDVAVLVFDPSSKSEPGKSLYRKIPHGKQSWYVQTSGLWQPVTLEFRPETYIDGIRVTAQIDGSVRINFILKGREAATGSVLADIRDRHGALVARQALPLGQQNEHEIVANVAKPELWSPEDPALYTVEAHVDSSPEDAVTTRFGFRKLEARDGKLFLNGKPFFMIGALDQDFYPDTIYSPPSHEYVRREMELAKRIGLNTLRCHIKVCEPEYLDAADEVGIVVWYEIPNWDDFTSDSARRGEETFDAMVARDWNHPSILIQSIINESWGINLKNSDERAWLRDMTQRAQAAVAPLGRLVVDNSPCCENFHMRSDLDDFHQYYSIPDNAAKWDAWVADFASRPKWSFSQHGDAQRTGKEPLIVSEFGNWGLPQLPATRPWWFARSNAEITRPAGVYDRFKQFKFDRIFRDYDELALATQWHQFLSLKHEIEEMRRHASIQGYVITEFTDLNWESNGLLTMWRKPKAYAQGLHDIQQSDVVLAILDHGYVKAGELVNARILVSHFSDRDLRDSAVFWWTDNGQADSISVGEVPRPQSVVDFEQISFTAPTRRSAGLTEVHLSLQLRDAENRFVAQNRYTIHVFQPGEQPSAKIAVYDPAGALSQVRNVLSAGGYDVAEPAPVMLASRWDDHVSAFISGGGTAIVLADSPNALSATLPLKLKERKGDYDGNWVSNFAWIDPHSPVFRDIAAGAILGWEAAAVTPRFVLTGVKPEQYDDVLSGMFYGWINLNSPLLVQARYGRGAVIVTTFRFDQYGADPYATALLDALVRYVSSDEFQPRMEWTR